jgi:hypothetical protein
MAVMKVTAPFDGMQQATSGIRPRFRRCEATVNIRADGLQSRVSQLNIRATEPMYGSTPN